MAFVKKLWFDKPNYTTPIMAADKNRTEKGIADAHNMVDAIAPTGGVRAVGKGEVNLRTHVTVGPTGDYSTIAAVFLDYPTGNIAIELQAGTIAHATTLVVSGVSNVHIWGQGRDATTVECTEGFLRARDSSDAWRIDNMTILHVAGTNTHDAIDVDYPRRWAVDNNSIRGFGGTSLWYRGGVHSRADFNNIIARDSTDTNGYAGLRIDLDLASIWATTMTARHNYVQAGKQYGYFIERTSHGCIFDANIAEYCDVGFRFVVAAGEVHSPYTENCTVGIEMNNCRALIISGWIRDEPIVTWSSAISSKERRIVRVGRSFLNPGIGIVYGGATGATDPTLAPSIRWGTGNPHGSQTAPPGSIWVNDTFSSSNARLYLKDNGTGTTGWVPLGVYSRTTADLNNAASSANNLEKFQGQQVFNKDSNRPVWATGALATSTWVFADGAVAHTPA